MSAKLDSQTALQWTQQGGTILCLQVPPMTQFGIDYLTWTVAEKFQGVKMVPPGVHYVHYAAADKLGGLGADREGAFCHIAVGEVLVWIWDPSTEQLVEMKDEEQKERLVAGVKRLEFDQNLAPYPLDTLKKWSALSCHISQKTIQRIQPKGVVINQFQPATFKSSRSSKKEQTKQEPILSPEEEKKKLQELEPVKQLNYTKIPRVIVPKGASLTDITRLHMDKSAILDQLITQDFKQDPQEIIGEMQFAFIAFFIGQSLESFEQWKALVILFSSCTTAIETHPQLFEQYAEVLLVHLEEAPDDFFVDELSKNNFVQEALKVLVETAAEYTISRELEKSIRKLKKLCKKKFKWDFDQQLNDANDEYAPVIVDEATMNQT